MDSSRFDNLARALATGASRRGLFRGLLGGIAAGFIGLATKETIAAARQPNGTPCNRATDCASFHCADGVCCNTVCTGQCESCASGACQPVSGPPPPGKSACPGTGPCALTCDGVTRTRCAGNPAAGATCGAATCASGWLTTYSCGSSGTCVPTMTNCAPFGCDASGDACATGCTSDAQCGAGSVCVAGQCQAAQSLGSGCTSGSQCQSGICAQEVCCIEACDGPCVACNLPGNEGFCGATVGVECDDGNPCTTNDVCQNNGECEGTPIGCEVRGACETAICNPTTEECDYRLVAPGTACRAAAGPCDVAEVCDGDSFACPSDDVRSDDFVCREASCVEGRPAPATTCDGTNVACPPPTLGEPCPAAFCASENEASISTCRDGACESETVDCGLLRCVDGACLLSCTGDGDCLGAAFCEGGFCLGDRPDGQPCERRDQCQSGHCAQGVCCNAACEGQCRSCNLAGTVGVCALTVGELCDDGDLCTEFDTCQSNGSCAGTPVVCADPLDCQEPGSCNPETGFCDFALKSDDTLCRAAAGLCDEAEFCDGVNPDCPPDEYKPADVECRPSAGGCDPAEFCTGSSAACPDDVLHPVGFPCQPASCTNAVATLEATCDGVSPECPESDVERCSPYQCADDGLTCRTDCDDEDDCTTAGDCQSGVCEQICLDLGVTCHSTDECCPDDFVDCSSTMEEDSVCCHGIGGACAFDGDCCFNSDRGASVFCSPAGACGGAEASCESRFGCLSRTCCDGVCCGEDQECTDEGLCKLAAEEPCTSPDACASGLCCDNFCADSNEDNCGACGNVCGDDESCIDDRCRGEIGASCESADDCINGFCYENVCCDECGGACGKPVPDNTPCLDGSEFACCGGSCRIVSEDTFNCGVCGVICPVGDICQESDCTCTASSNCAGGSLVPRSCHAGCLCITTLEGSLACVQQAVCGESCSGSADCGSNEVCGHPTNGDCCRQTCHRKCFGGRP